MITESSYVDSVAAVKHINQGRINHSGAPYQRKAGALFSYA